MIFTATQMQRSFHNIENLINEYPENKSRIHIAFLKKIGLIKNPESYEEKVQNINIVKKLFEAGWQDENIVKALKNYHLDKKYVIELLLIALNSYFLHQRFNHAYPVGSAQDKSGRKKLSDEQKKHVISRIINALISANWDDDEIAALILKFETGSLLANILEQVKWNDSRIVKTLDDTKKSKFTILLFLKNADWDDVRIVKAISQNKWTDYNIVNELSNNIKWDDQRLIQALLNLPWDLNRICSAFYYFWTGQRILKAFIQIPLNLTLLASVAQILLQNGKIETEKIISILNSDPLNFNDKQTDSILAQCQKDILPWQTIESLI